MKSILVIGASSGIGRALALQLADKGYRVFGTYNQTSPPPATENLSFHPLDAAEDDLVFDFLPDQLDGLAYCPGRIDLRPFHRFQVQDFRDDYEVQVLGAVRSIQSNLTRLKKSDQGSIVLFSTVAVQSGFGFHSVVSSSKGAIEGLTRSLAAELTPKIRVNAIAPSITDTPLAGQLLSSDEKKEANAQRHPLKSVGKADDMAHAASFLLSGESRWMTGQILHVDGGKSAISM